VEKYGRTRQATDDSIIRSMRFTYWIPKGTNPLSEHVIRIGLPLQHWLHECAYILCYTHSAFLVLSESHLATLLFAVT
jgi:hypothetical protein